MGINLQTAFDLAAPIANTDLSGKKSALLLRVVNGLRFQDKNAFLARALCAGPSVPVRLYINDEPGVHVGIVSFAHLFTIRLASNCQQFVRPPPRVIHRCCPHRVENQRRTIPPLSRRPDGIPSRLVANDAFGFGFQGGVVDAPRSKIKFLDRNLGERSSG
jgi:hypothetical protein